MAFKVDIKNEKIRNFNPESLIVYAKPGLGKTPLLASLSTPTVEGKWIKSLAQTVEEWNNGWKLVHFDLEFNPATAHISARSLHLPTREAYEKMITDVTEHIYNKLLKLAFSKKLLTDSKFEKILNKKIDEIDFEDIKRLKDENTKIKITLLLQKLKSELTEEEKIKVYPYMIGVLDQMTVFETWVDFWAMELFKSSPEGKNFRDTKYTSVLNDTEAGFKKKWYYLREALKEATNSFRFCFPHSIFVCHTRDKLISKGLTESVTVKDLALMGVGAEIFVSTVDACAYMYKNKAGEIMITFDRDEDTQSKGRCPHLWNLKTQLDWSKIYLKPE